MAALMAVQTVVSTVALMAESRVALTVDSMVVCLAVLKAVMKAGQ